MQKSQDMFYVATTPVPSYVGMVYNYFSSLIYDCVIHHELYSKLFQGVKHIKLYNSCKLIGNIPIHCGASITTM